MTPQRLAGWLDGFAERHGDAGSDRDGGGRTVVVRGGDGARAEVHVPFPPLPDAEPVRDALLAHAGTDRRVGVLLVRRGGHAAGILDGERLVASKVGSRYVQGRTAAGGWSQQRFARRRDGQLRDALRAAADVAVAVLVPEADAVAAVVTGGDRRMLRDVLDDPRLAVLRPLVADRVLDVPDPRLRVLAATPAAVRAVRIRVLDPPPR